MKTREGNPVYPARCNMREAVFDQRPASPCASCMHLGDLCGTLERTHATNASSGYSYVAVCNGEEGIATTTDDKNATEGLAIAFGATIGDQRY